MALITNVNLFLILSIKCHKYIGASILINFQRFYNKITLRKSFIFPRDIFLS